MTQDRISIRKHKRTVWIMRAKMLLLASFAVAATHYGPGLIKQCAKEPDDCHDRLEERDMKIIRLQSYLEERVK